MATYTMWDLGLSGDGRKPTVPRVTGRFRRGGTFDAVEHPFVVTVLVGRPVEHVDPDGRLVRTAFRKEPVDGPVEVGATNLAGDEQADLRVHGGPHKAVLVYSADHGPAWRDFDARMDAPGAFGENLHVTGLTEADVCIGDRWRVGSAVFEVSQPRQPCWKANDRWGRDDVVDEMERTGRTGWYHRVIETGSLGAGDRCELLERPHPEWTVAEANDLMHHRRDDEAGARALAAVPALAPSWVRTLTARADRAEAGEPAVEPGELTGRRDGPAPLG